MSRYTGGCGGQVMMRGEKHWKREGVADLEMTQEQQRLPKNYIIYLLICFLKENNNCFSFCATQILFWVSEFEKFRERLWFYFNIENIFESKTM